MADDAYHFGCNVLQPLRFNDTGKDMRSCLGCLHRHFPGPALRPE